MKALINGTEFEGSPEEIRKFMAIQSGTVQKPLVPAWRRLQSTGKRQRQLRAARIRRLKKTPLAVLEEINQGFGMAQVARPRSEVFEEVLQAPDHPLPAEDETKFPELPFADKKLAFQVFRRAATLNNTLNFSGDGFVLGVEDFQAWRQFCEEVLLHADEIAAAIGHMPKLTHVGRGITVSFERVKQ